MLNMTCPVYSLTRCQGQASHGRTGAWPHPGCTTRRPRADARGMTSQPAGTGTGRKPRGPEGGESATHPAGTGPGGTPEGPPPPLLLVLTVVTGVVDAVSILRLGRVFVANMTGNVVFSAFALVGAPGFSLSASLDTTFP